MEQSINSYKQIIEFAVGHELKSYRLYLDLAEKMVSQKTKQLCKELAKEERSHIVRLEKENAKNFQLSSPANLEKYDIAHDPINIFANNLSMLSFAIKKEKASMQLYRDLAELTNNEQARQLFMSLAEEEAKHEHQLGLEYNICLK